MTDPAVSFVYFVSFVVARVFADRQHARGKRFEIARRNALFRFLRIPVNVLRRHELRQENGDLAILAPPKRTSRRVVATRFPERTSGARASSSQGLTLAHIRSVWRKPPRINALRHRNVRAIPPENARNGGYHALDIGILPALDSRPYFVPPRKEISS